MRNRLFDSWKTKIPKYSKVHESIFSSLSKKGGAEGEKLTSFGKNFSTYYELYIYAFFLGLYNNERRPFQPGEEKKDFSQAIQFWGNKTSIHRKSFASIQENIFIATIAKTDIDFIALDKGELSEKKVISMLIQTLEEYTNGGLVLIKDKLEINKNYFLQPTSFLDLIMGEPSNQLSEE